MIKFLTAQVIALLTCVLCLSLSARGKDQSEAELLALVSSALPLETQDLSTPVKTTSRDGTVLWAPNADGQTWDILHVYYPFYGGNNTVVTVDLATEEVTTITTEKGWWFNIPSTVIAPNGKLFISVLKDRISEVFELDQSIAVYDPVTNTLTMDAVEMPEILGNTHPLVLGTDGMIYALGHLPGNGPATAVQIDPDTLEAKSYGPIGHTHGDNVTYTYSGAADDRYIYLASGKVPWFLVAYDRQEETWETLLESEATDGFVSVGQQANGATGSAWGIKDTDGAYFTYWLHDGQLVPTEGNENPLPTREPFRSDPPQPTVDLGFGPDLEGNVTITVRDAGESARTYSFQVPTYGQPIYRLHELPDGYAIADFPEARVFGTAAAYQGNFAFDAVTGTGKHLGRLPLSHYCTTFHNGKIYMSGYPRSPLYEYDPARLWNTGTVIDSEMIDGTQEISNPRLVATLGEKEFAGTHKMFAAVTGADNRVYFGGKWWRDGDAGGLAWYDPATAEVGGFWEALSNYQVSHMATIDDARKLVLSTWRMADPLLGKPTPAEGALFTFDTTTGELSEPFAPIPGTIGTGPILAIDNQHVFGWASHPTDAGRSILYLADIPAKSVIFTKELPFAMPVTPDSLRTEAWDFRIGPDGAIWTFLDDALTRITPLDGCVDVLGKVEPGQIAFLNGAILLGGQPQVRSVRITQPAEPQINWRAPDPIRYGTALDATQLNATVDFPGTLSYSPATGTVLSAGAGQEITVTFNPESADAATASMTVTIDVTPADLTISADDIERPPGTSNPTLTASYSGFVNGDTVESLTSPATLSTTADVESPPGDYPIVASGATSPNYTITFVPGTLTVMEPPAAGVGPAAIGAVTRDGDSISFILQWGTVPGATYYIEQSEDLVTWSKVPGHDSILADLAAMSRKITVTTSGTFYVRAVGRP
ncbi:MAG: MBG domain-containing protein [Verrucomicrobiales bacterium]